MDRTKSPPIDRKDNDSTYLRKSSEIKNFVSNTKSTLNFVRAQRSGFDYGNIAAPPQPLGASARHYLKLLDRRSTHRVSAVLAGLLACAATAPASATPASDTITAPDASRASEPAIFVGENGSASWYAASRHSRRTASGAPYNQRAMTAAHPWLPFGTKVRVTRRDTGHSIIVTINDRLPSKRHIIDLSVGAAQQLGMLREGTTQVDLTPV
jgi:rare lipoprotein A